MERINKAVSDLNSNEILNILSEGNSSFERTTIANYSLQLFIERHFSSDQDQMLASSMLIENSNIPVEHLMQAQPQLNTPVISLEHETFLELLLRNGADLFESYELYPENSNLLRTYVDDSGAYNRVEDGSLFFLMLCHIIENNQFPQLMQTLSDVFSGPRLILFRELLEITNLRVLNDQEISQEFRESLLDALREMNGGDFPEINFNSDHDTAAATTDFVYTENGDLLIPESDSRQIDAVNISGPVIEVNAAGDIDEAPWVAPVYHLQEDLTGTISNAVQPIGEQELLNDALNGLNTPGAASMMFNNNCD